MVFISAFVVNLMLAMFGHGGVTVAGLNTLVLAAEATLGYYLFRWSWSLLRTRQSSPAFAGGIATVFALLLSSLLMIGIVALSDAGVSVQARALPEELSFENPFEHGLVSSAWLESDTHGEEVAPAARIDVAAFARLVILFGVLGWAIEGLLTGAIVGFVHKVRPDLVGGQPSPGRFADKRVG
jgi:cobalt/nickel transport system permease protein